MTSAAPDDQREIDGGKPSYGGSRHYQGSEGTGYFDWQSFSAEAGAELTYRMFSGYVQPTDTLLDFGCGGGALLLRMQCARRIGVEINPSARAYAQERGLECAARIEDVADEFVDVIITNHTLEHVPYPIDALRQLRHKLRPGGSLVICVPMDDWRNQKTYNSVDRNHHLHTWTPLLLGNTLAEAGFDVEPSDVQILNHAWPKHHSRYRHLMPSFAFNALCRFWSIARRQRQVLAVVRR